MRGGQVEVHSDLTPLTPTALPLRPLKRDPPRVPEVALVIVDRRKEEDQQLLDEVKQPLPLRKWKSNDANRIEIGPRLRSPLPSPATLDVLSVAILERDRFADVTEVSATREEEQ